MTSSTLPQMYDITVINGVAKNESYIDITKAKPGDKVVLLADDRRDKGLAFEKWVVTGATVDAENNRTAKFIMPEGNVTAEATYIPCDISIKAVELTLDNYAVGNKAGDISVEITTPDVLFSGSGEYNQGYQIAIPDGEWIGGTITVRFLDPDEKLEAGADYYLFVFVKAADGSTLKDLTAANAKLDGKAAEAVDLLSDGVTAVIIFKLTPLEASHTHTYGTEWKSDAYKHWHECSCGAKSEEAAHTASDWITDTVATATTDGTKHKECTVCKRVLETGTIPATGSGGGGGYTYYTIKATAGVNGSISPSGNVSVREGRDQTFTITPDKGYAVANVKIDGKSIGAVKSYTFENVSRTHTIEVIFMKANGNPQTGVFVDVATGSYYADAVDWAVENGITKGTDDTHFSPDGICTRAQAVTFLWRTAGSPASKTSAMPFTDVPVGSYYYDAVLWAVENGITKGTSETTFSPDADCTRAQIVTFIWRALAE